MLRLFQLLAVLGAALASRSCQNCSPLVPKEAVCPLPVLKTGDLMPLVKNANAQPMDCFCNCCTFSKNGRPVTDKEQTCVIKNINEVDPIGSETCDCNCPIPPQPQGVQGCKGKHGVAGGKGRDGPNGPDGINGIHGKPGYGGPHGNDGQDIPDCKPGQPGRNGPPGVSGKNGRQGQAGQNGRSGQPGRPGPMGPVGVEGKMGGKGRPGNAGPPGHRGATGVAGKPGMPGKVGHPGERGPAGAPGADGKPGNRGPAGKDGRVGMKGMAGVKGQMGATGARGPVGEAGMKGEQGRNGQDSQVQGPQGAPGMNGPPGQAGEDAVFDWAEIDVMVANFLYNKLSHGSEYCGKANEMCKCGTQLIIEPKLPEPEPQPTRKPVLDMVVLVDGSESLNNEDWGALKNWLVDFIHAFNTPEIKAKYDRTSAMVVVQFSTHNPGAHTNFGAEDGYIIKRGQLSELDNLEDELQNMFKMSQGTDTYMALEYVMHDVVPSMDNEWRHFDDSVRHNRVLTMVVNGEPNDADFNGEYNSKWQHRTLENHALLEALDATFTDRYVIGVGSGISENHSAYSQINHNSLDLPMWRIDKYLSSDMTKSTLNQEFLENVVSQLTSAILARAEVSHEFWSTVEHVAEPY